MAESPSLPAGARRGQFGRERHRAHRARALAWCLLAVVYAIFAQQFATHAALVLVPGLLYPLASRAFFVVLLLVGFGAIARLEQRHTAPVVALGLPRRPGFAREWATGAALGWAGVVACVLPVALTGGLVVTGTGRDPGALAQTFLDLFTLLLAALADEVLFRGYPFERLIAAAGPTLATIGMAILFALGRSTVSAASPGSVLVTLLLGFLLAMAYLRTRALWVGWGFHFAWTASMAVVFGLPVGGLTDFSPLLSTYSSGPAWLTGGGYGPEGSAVAIFVVLGLLVVMAFATRELKHRWATPELVGAGIPVDIDGFAQRQHVEAMGPEPSPAGSQLVQIAPANSAAALPPAKPPIP